MSFLNALFGAKAPRMVEIPAYGARFEVPAGKTILQAALAAGLAYPHDCTVGTCGTCKSRLISGRINALSETAYTLSSQELAANFILPCQSMPRDTLVTLDVALDADHTAVGRYQGHIITTRPLTHDILEIEVALDRPVSYLAGQYLNIAVAGIDGPRSYSLAAPPVVGGTARAALCIRKVPGGSFTEALFAGRLDGMTLQIDGPHGAFHLRKGTGPIVCVAGGSGLAPILSLLETVTQQPTTRPRPSRKALLLFGARTQLDLYALERIATIQAAWPAPFTFLPVLSHESAASAWSGARGWVTAFMGDSGAGEDWRTAQAYLCGPPGMIDAGIAELSGLGLARGAIFHDKFTDASNAPRASLTRDF